MCNLIIIVKSIDGDLYLAHLVHLACSSVERTQLLRVGTDISLPTGAEEERGGTTSGVTQHSDQSRGIVSPWN